MAKKKKKRDDGKAAENLRGLASNLLREYRASLAPEKRQELDNLPRGVE